jgi:hypothetical protein
VPAALRGATRGIPRGASALRGATGGAASTSSVEDNSQLPGSHRGTPPTAVASVQRDAAHLCRVGLEGHR